MSRERQRNQSLHVSATQPGPVGSYSSQSKCSPLDNGWRKSATDIPSSSILDLDLESKNHDNDIEELSKFSSLW